MARVIAAEEIVLPGGELRNGPHYVTIDGDRVVSIATKPPVSCSQTIETHLLVPGLIDLHTHGLGGANDVIDFWTNPDYTLSRLPKVGTTGCLATIVFPKGHPRTPQLLDALREAVGQTGRGAILEGVNAEGPVVNDYGGLPESDRDISLEEFERLIDSIPSLKLMTISPHIEAKSNYLRLKALLSRGVKPSLGHDRVATEDEILGALRLSKKPLHMTHLFNVCNFNHRQPGLVNIGLTSTYPTLPQYIGITPPTVEVIGDLTHVHPLTLTLLLQTRGYESVSFITDSVYHSNQPGETIQYNGRHLVVSEDCKTMVLQGTSTLAGSCSSMLDIFHNLVRVLNVPIAEAVRMLAENPAKVAGLTDSGVIAVNKRADLLLLDNDLTLTQTIVAGKTAWKRRD